MNSLDQDKPPRAKLETSGFAGQAAKASWMTCLVVFVLLVYGRQTIGIITTEIISLGLILVGLCLAIFALASIGKLGRQGIWAPAVVGLLINGLLLSIFATNFFAARAKVRVAGRALDAQQTAKAPARLAGFHRGTLTFAYDTRYEVASYGTQGQTLLKHPDSQVLLTQYADAADMNEFLQSAAGQIKAEFERMHYTDIRQGAIEPLRTVSGSAGKVTLKYTPPGRSRTVSEMYFISNETNAIGLVHVYPESRSNVALSMFGSVLNSFLK